MNAPYQDQNNDLINLINVLSFVIGYSNLQENRQQSAHNSIQAANSAQTEYLLNEINREFDKQNRMLERLIKLLEEDV